MEPQILDLFIRREIIQMKKCKKYGLHNWCKLFIMLALKYETCIWNFIWTRLNCVLFNVPIIAKETKQSNLTSGKPWKLERGQNVHFQGEGLPYKRVVGKSLFSRRGCHIRGRRVFSIRRLIPLCILWCRKRQPSDEGATQVQWGACFNIQGMFPIGGSPLHGWGINNTGLDRPKVLPPCPHHEKFWNEHVCESWN